MSYLKRVVLASLISTALATPLGHGSNAGDKAPRQILWGGQECYDRTYYKVTDTVIANGTAFLAAAHCTNQGGQCSLGHAVSFSISTAVTVGGGLGLDIPGIATTASIGATYTSSTVKGVSDSTSVQCGDGKGEWTCALLVTPFGKNVKGYQYKGKPDTCGGTKDPGHGDNYEVWYPQIDGQKLPEFESHTCTCPDKPHADEKGAPPKCPMNCS